MAGIHRQNRRTRAIRLTKLTRLTSMTRQPSMRSTNGPPGCFGRARSGFRFGRRGGLASQPPVFFFGLFCFCAQPGPSDSWGAPTLIGARKLGYAKPPTEPTGMREATDGTGRSIWVGSTGPILFKTSMPIGRRTNFRYKPTGALKSVRKW